MLITGLYQLAHSQLVLGANKTQTLELQAVEKWIQCCTSTHFTFTNQFQR